MRFRDYFSVKQILFSAAIVALMIIFAFIQSDNLVKVHFEDSSVQVISSRYSMDIPYADIASAELTDLADAGEEVANSRDDDTIRTGCWSNSVWGEYHIVADLDPTNCIVVHHKDGRIFVFNRKDNAETAKLYETLLSQLS